ncbi:MAG: adenosine deaminase family protein [Candidatus Actinomarina sp.]|nr:adenosine deaminase family protein [Actinomycetota bacterium]MBL6833003.1 adenosine deaminase family protein [Candidatus Actinomarina sp.]MBL6836867.1 adenosine deaminase family protein [Candidatus Actinomarina sp.]
MNRAVLHDHLDGGLRAATASELANQINYTPLQNIDNIATFFDRSDCKSLEEYLEAFTHTIALMQSFENLERIAFEAAEDMHNNGITMYESRYAPFFSVNSNLSPTDVIDAINSGFNQAHNTYGIVSGLILCGMRHDIKNVKMVGDLAIENRNKIIGFDIAGPELNFRPSLFNETFKNLNTAGVNITIHAGEGDNVESIQEALDNGAQRIGHGIRIIEDINLDTKTYGKTASYVLENQIPLEVCITSNIHTGIYANVEAHPINELVDFGFQVSLNTDNRLMSNTSIKKELSEAKRSGVEHPEELLINSASYSFLN